MLGLVGEHLLPFVIRDYLVGELGTRQLEAAPLVYLLMLGLNLIVLVPICKLELLRNKILLVTLQGCLVNKDIFKAAKYSDYV